MYAEIPLSRSRFLFQIPGTYIVFTVSESLKVREVQRYFNQSLTKKLKANEPDFLKSWVN